MVTGLGILSIPVPEGLLDGQVLSALARRSYTQPHPGSQRAFFRDSQRH